MASKLVIVESPTKAKTIAKLLGKEYKVMASNGHVRDLPSKTLGVRVDKNFEPIYCTTPERRKLARELAEAAQKAKTVYLATDPDREGEAISWHLATILDMNPETACRITFNEITKKAVTSAVEEPRAIDLDLVNAQQARRILDRLVGYNISPLLWEKVKKGLSAGRVQSVAERILVEREEEIRAFVPREYWTLNAQLLTADGESIDAKFVGKNGKKFEPANEEEAALICETLKGATYCVTEVTKKERKKNAAPPFTTSNMQQEASRKLGFSTKRTMMVAQQLYEGIDIGKEGTVGLVTYIRTDSVRSSEDSVRAAREFIEARYGKDYLPSKPNAYRTNKNAQDAHEAIRPSDVMRTPESIKEFLTKEQYKLYKLIYDRFVASQMAPMRFIAMGANITANGMDFRATGTKTLFPGFTAVYGESDDEDSKELPFLSEGDVLKLKKLVRKQHFTEPPARYTEATLVKELEEKGIGRPSTYAPTISTILQRKYAERDGKSLVPTELGITVVHLLKDHFSEIVDLKFTAEMEAKLDDIEFGKKEWVTVLGEFYGPFKTELDKAKISMQKVKVPDRESDTVCEACGAKMVYKEGRYGTFLACPNYPKCKNTKKIVETIDAKCPVCGEAIVLRTAKKTGKKFYGCSAYPKCNFISKGKPAPMNCPDCDGMMVEKTKKDGTVYYLCINKECGKKVEDTNESKKG